MSVRASNKLHQKDKADVIIVLGAAVWAGGVPSPALRRRALHAVELFQQGLSDVLIVSGGIGKNPPSEARIMRRLAVQQGISEKKLLWKNPPDQRLTVPLPVPKFFKKIDGPGPCW